MTNPTVTSKLDAGINVTIVIANAIKRDTFSRSCQIKMEKNEN